MGKILAICTSPRRGTLKTPVPSAVLTPEWGIVGDAHGGSWHRQVSLLSAEKIEAFRQKLWVDYGAFGENLVVEGFDLATLPVPSFFAIGDARSATATAPSAGRPATASCRGRACSHGW